MSNNGKTDKQIVKIVKRGKNSGKLEDDKEVGGEPESELTDEQKKAIQDADKKLLKVIEELDKESSSRVKDLLSMADGEAELLEATETLEKDYELSDGFELEDTVDNIFEDVQIMANQKVLKNVVMLTAISKNNRLYRQGALDDVVRLVNSKPMGCKSFINHSKDQMGAVTNIIGKFTNARRMEDGKIIADLHLLDKWSDFINDLATTMPDSVGFSLVSRGHIEVQPDATGREVVSKIESIRICNLVSSAAAVCGNYETINPMDKEEIKRIVEAIDESMKNNL